METYFKINGCEVTFDVPSSGGNWELKNNIADFINENIHRYTKYYAVSGNGLNCIWKFSFGNEEDVKQFFVDLNNNKETSYKMFGSLLTLYGKKCVTFNFLQITDELKEHLAEQHTAGLVRFQDHRERYWKFIFSNEDERSAFIESLKHMLEE